jgi:hypothetical protein
MWVDGYGTDFVPETALHCTGLEFWGREHMGILGLKKGRVFVFVFAFALLSIALDIDINFYTALLLPHFSEMRWHVHTYTEGSMVWRLHGEGHDGPESFMESARSILFFWD